MTVAAFLPPRLLRHVQFILGREHPFVAESWDDLEQMIRTRPVRVAIVDPSADEATGTERIQEILIDYPSIQVIAYVTVTASSFRAVAELSRAGLKHVMMYSVDDSPERFLAMLDMVRASPLTVQLLADFRPSLNKLPVSLRRAVEDMFAEPHMYGNAADIAAKANVPLVRLYRALRGSGVASPKKLLVAAKLLRAYGDLGDPGQSIRRVSRRLGWKYTRVLFDHTFEVFGLSPARVRQQMTDDEVVARLVEWMTTGNETEETEDVSRATG
jgi:hypothetical protein